jgi:hypothetical protein
VNNKLYWFVKNSTLMQGKNIFHVHVQMCVEDYWITELCWRHYSIEWLNADDIELLPIYNIDVCWRLSDCRCLLMTIWLQKCLEGYQIAEVCWKLSDCRSVLKTIALLICAESYRIAEVFCRLSDCRCVLKTLPCKMTECWCCRIITNIKYRF